VQVRGVSLSAKDLSSIGAGDIGASLHFHPLKGLVFNPILGCMTGNIRPAQLDYCTETLQALAYPIPNHYLPGFILGMHLHPSP
jgi:hypothetical protein